jgi:hypothetical protein
VTLRKRLAGLVVASADMGSFDYSVASLLRSHASVQDDRTPMACRRYRSRCG